MTRALVIFPVLKPPGGHTRKGVFGCNFLRGFFDLSVCHWIYAGGQEIATIPVTLAANAKEILGYFPSTISFSLPSNRYFQR